MEYVVYRFFYLLGSLFFITVQNNITNPLPDAKNKVMTIIISPVGVVTADINNATVMLPF